MPSSLLSLVDSISGLPDDWHKAGSMSRAVLAAIARQCDRIGPVRRSVETGSGKTTLLFSHASEQHSVFAMEDGNGSITQVQKSGLLRGDTVEFVDGPTQKTLPAQRFADPIDIALIDGPHGYPFPDLEYWHLYPHIRQGGVLIVDDLKIPTIRRMFEIIKADAMWELLEVVDDTAFFERTGEELVNPHGDDWWKQGFNKAYYDSIYGPKNPLLQFPKKVIHYGIHRTRRLFGRGGAVSKHLDDER